MPRRGRRRDVAAVAATDELIGRVLDAIEDDPYLSRHATARRTGTRSVRNADLANLTTGLLDLPAVGGSTINRARRLDAGI